MINTNHKRLKMKVLMGHRSEDTRRLTRQHCAELYTDEAEEAKYGQDRIVVLTTPQSFQRQVYDTLAKFEYSMIQVNPQSKALNPKMKREVRIRLGVKFSKVVKDECHQEKAETTASPFIIRRLRDQNLKDDMQDKKERQNSNEMTIEYQGPPYVWALSGTPMEISPRDIVPWISCLNHGQFEDDEVLKTCTINAITRTALQFEGLVGKDLTEGQMERLKICKAKLGKYLPILMIQRTTHSRWYDGRTCIRLSLFFVRDVPATLNST